MDPDWRAACFRNREPWHPVEDRRLLNIFAAGDRRVKWMGEWRKHPAFVAAKTLGRSPGACSARRWQLLRAPALAARARKPALKPSTLELAGRSK